MKLTVDIQKKLKDFTLSVAFETKAEEVFALLGPSGAGKSMTLRCIAGIEQPDSGVITLGDTVFYDSKKKICLPARKRNTGYLFQNYALFPHMTVEENIAIAAKKKEKVRELIDRFFLTGKEKAYPSQLSGGQQQRTALARMLAAEPALLLFDEPFSALDNYLKMLLEREICGVLKTFPGPVVLVSHDRDEVYRLSDTCAVIDNGRMTGVRDCKAFFKEPGDVLSARLTGCKNISRLEKKDGRLFAADWGIFIKGDVPQGTSHVGYRAHFLKKADKEKPENTVTLSAVTVTETPFSFVLNFTAEQNREQTPDALLTWEMDKASFKALQEEGLSGLVAEFSPEYFLWLKS